MKPYIAVLIVLIGASVQVQGHYEKGVKYEIPTDKPLREAKKIAKSWKHFKTEYGILYQEKKKRRALRLECFLLI